MPAGTCGDHAGVTGCGAGALQASASVGRTEGVPLHGVSTGSAHDSSTGGPTEAAVASPHASVVPGAGGAGGSTAAGAHSEDGGGASAAAGAHSEEGASAGAGVHSEEGGASA